MKDIIITIFTSILLVVMALFLIAILSIYLDHVNKPCVDNGFEYNDIHIPAEEGYVTCCTNIYEDHIEVDKVCKGVKK